MEAALAIEVLLVEDSPSDALLAQAALRAGRIAFHVTQVTCLADALTRLQSNHIDVVLLDLALPDSRGLDPMRAIQALGRDLPIVVLTGSDDDVLALQAMAEGAQDYVVKGRLDPETFVRAIRYAIERSGSAALLRRSEERFRLLVEEIQDYAIIMLDPTGLITSWNAGAERITGYTEEEALDQPFTLFFADKDIEAGTPSRLLQAAATEGRVREEGWRVRKDGGVFWADVVINVRHDDSAPGFTYITHDVTERRRAEQSLRQSESQFRSVAENISAILWVLDASGTRVLYVSGAYERIFGRSCESLYEDFSTYLDVVHPDDLSVASSIVERLALDGVCLVTFRVIRGDRAVSWLRLTCTAVRDPDGTIQRFVGISEDVTDQKKAEEVATRLSAIVESCEDAIVCHTVEGIVTDWNRAAERLYGYTSAEIVGTSIARLYPPERVEEMYDSLACISRGDQVRSHQTQRLRKDGERIEVTASIAPLTISNAYVVGGAAIMHDLTETLRLQDQYRHAQRMEAVGRLAGGVAHDFNNLLTIISGYSDIVRGTLSESDPTWELVDEINKAGERAATLTRQLLAFSRKSVLQPTVLDLNAVITDSVRMLGRLMGEDVEAVVDLTPSIGRVHADAGQFEQALVNLAVNARDAMPQGGTLTVQTCDVDLDETFCRAHLGSVPGPYVMVQVSDTGVGIDEAIQARIFEPFFTTKELGRGTGLGLAMVYGFVKQSGGYIVVNSEVGRGTSFEIYFPRIAAGARTNSAIAPAAAPDGTETILLVEDEDGVRALARHVLRQRGYTVLDARNGIEALHLAEEHASPIHLLLTDVVMPGMSGRLVAERVTRIKPDIKVLFTSGYTDDEVVRHGIRQAETPFLQKPYSPGAIARKVRELLDS